MNGIHRAMLPIADRARTVTTKKIVSAVVAPRPTKKPARNDRVTVCEAMTAFTGPGGAARESAIAMPARTAPRTSRTTIPHLEEADEGAAGTLIEPATLGRADADRSVDVQPRTIPETGRRGAGSRLRLRGARPHVGDLGTGQTGRGGSGSLEKTAAIDSTSPSVAIPSGGPRAVRRLHGRPRAPRHEGLQRAFPGSPFGSADLGADEDVLALRSGSSRDGPGRPRGARERGRATGSAEDGPRRDPGPEILPGRRARAPRQADGRRPHVPRGPRRPPGPGPHPRQPRRTRGGGGRTPSVRARDDRPGAGRPRLEGARLRGIHDPRDLQRNPRRQEGVPSQDATLVSTVTKSAKSAAGSHRLAPLAREYWDAYLQQSPLFATAIGVRGYDDSLSDITPEDRAEWIAQLEAFHEKAVAIPEKGLRPAERTTRSELITSIRTDLDSARSDLEEWTIDPLNGPVVSFLNVESYQPARTPVDGDRMVTRWEAMASYMDD